MTIEIVILGSGNAFADDGFHQSAHLINYSPSKSLLLDCGPTILASAKQNHRDINLSNINILLISHLHGDHLAGIPFLLLHYKYLEPRIKPLQIYGPPGLKKHLNLLIQSTYPSIFDNTNNLYQTFELSLESGLIEIDSAIRVQPFEAIHIPDAFFYKIHFENNFVIAYSGDNQFTIEKQLKAIKNADVLIHECSFLDFDVGGHTSWNLLNKHLDTILSNVKMLILVHLDTNVRKASSEMFPKNVYRAIDGSKYLFND
ncbi:MAG: MBL fold metallo-hydrolase [Candidatus Hodarchaeales archaeon]